MDNLLLQGCELRFHGDSICIYAPDEAIACELSDSLYWLASWAKTLNKRDARVFYPGCRKPYQIPARWAIAEASTSSEEIDRPSPNLLSLTPQPKEQRLRGIIQSVAELDWNAVFNGGNPIYITQLHDQRNLFLNQAAVNAQSGKPPAEFLAGTAHTLNFEDELVNRCEHLIVDGSLSLYEYEAMRWFLDDRGLWVRRKMQFVSNFWKVDYLGQPCWMGEVLQAEAIAFIG
jgi:PAS domain-containing protein